MTGTITGILNARSFWLLTVNTGDRIVEQVIEPRYMADIVEAEGLESPYDLEGREIELTDSGLAIGLPR